MSPHLCTHLEWRPLITEMPHKLVPSGGRISVHLDTPVGCGKSVRDVGQRLTRQRCPVSASPVKGAQSAPCPAGLHREYRATEYWRGATTPCRKAVALIL